MRRNRAQAEEERIKNGFAVVETPSGEIRLGAVFERGSAHKPLPESPGSEREVVEILESPGMTCVASTPLNRRLG
jgi:hypothetical protein